MPTLGLASVIDHYPKEHAAASAEASGASTTADVADLPPPLHRYHHFVRFLLAGWNQVIDLGIHYLSFHVPLCLAYKARLSSVFLDLFGYSQVHVRYFDSGYKVHNLVEELKSSDNWEILEPVQSLKTMASRFRSEGGKALSLSLQDDLHNLSAVLLPLSQPSSII